MYERVLSFWFDEIDESQWWSSDPALDLRIRNLFLALHQKAASCELFSWRSHAKGALAEIIVLDQFSRNMFRDTPSAFAYDSLALCLAQQAVELGFDDELSEAEKVFLYMPFMHSESLFIHQRTLQLFSELGLEDQLKYEYRYIDILERFGRFPHRNASRGLTSTKEEVEYLNSRC